jgi:flagellar hook-basal body complex protein FliE
MTDPLGFVNASRNIGPQPGAGGIDRAATNGPSFKDVLLKNIDEVNQLQQDANRAAEDLMTGQRNDLESVLMATQKADTAFRALQAVRNKVMEAYDEVKQIRI